MTNERTLAQYRVPYATWIGAAICLAAIAPLLYLGRHLNFLSDEWTFIVHRNDSGIAALLRPHNEHWSTLLTVILRALFATIGLRVYWPYLLLLELFHVATAFVLFLLVRRRAGEVLGLAAMLAILFIGRGAENIFWAFQIGFVGSVLFGLVAMLALDPPNPGRGRLVVASVAMLLALMFSGIGIFFCAAIAVQLLVDRRRHAQLGVAILPVLAYLVWFFAYGRAGAVSHRFPLSPTALISLPAIQAVLSDHLMCRSLWALRPMGQCAAGGRDGPACLGLVSARLGRRCRTQSGRWVDRAIRLDRPGTRSVR